MVIFSNTGEKLIYGGLRIDRGVDLEKDVSAEEAAKEKGAWLQEKNEDKQR